MSDIAKARFYLKTRNSDMQHLTSFGLMLATAEQRYRDVKMRQRGDAEIFDLTDKKIEIMLDVAVLRFMKHNNRLPNNVSDALHPETTLEDKYQLALGWMNR